MKNLYGFIYFLGALSILGILIWTSTMSPLQKSEPYEERAFIDETAQIEEYVEPVVEKIEEQKATTKNNNTTTETKKNTNNNSKDMKKEETIKTDYCGENTSLGYILSKRKDLINAFKRVRVCWNWSYNRNRYGSLVAAARSNGYPVNAIPEKGDIYVGSVMGYVENVQKTKDSESGETVVSEIKISYVTYSNNNSVVTDMMKPNSWRGGQFIHKKQ